MATVAAPQIKRTQQISWGIPAGKVETNISNAELQSIERGFADFQQGNVISHTQARKRYEKWL